MKWIFLAAMLGAIPLVVNWVNQNPRYARYLWITLGMSPFLFLEVALIPWPYWSGYVKGMSVSSVDAVAIAALFCRAPGVRPPLPLKLPIVLYLLAVLAAIPHAPVPFAASFFLWQLLRTFLFFAAVARVAAISKGSEAIFTGVIFGLTFQAIAAIIARAGGALQTGGTLGNQNLLGFVSHMAVIPAFALLLAGRQTRLAMLGLISGMIVVILTASRATIGLSAIGLTLTFVLSAGMRWSGRKAIMGMTAAAILIVGYPLSVAALQRRFDAQQVYTDPGNPDYDERAAFNKAARMMIADHPWGVGPNSYVTITNVDHYSDRAGVIWASGSRSANVHNSFLLIAAETGYPGFITFAILMASAMFAALGAAWRYRSDPRSEILIGLGVAIIIVALHALYEWIFVLSPTQYMYALTMATIFGVRRQLLAKDGERTDLNAGRGPAGARYMLSALSSGDHASARQDKTPAGLRS